jgi:hypothetical protein
VTNFQGAVMLDQDERERQAELAVRQHFFVRLTPLVDLAMRGLDRVAGDGHDPAERRRAIERHLAFSAPFPPYAISLLLLLLPISILGGISLLEDGRWTHAIVMWTFAVACLLMFLLVLAMHIRGLMRQIARCVPVPARVKVWATHGGWSSTMADVDYNFGGVPFHGALQSKVPASWFAGGVGEILVDPLNPGAFFLKDLYATGPRADLLPPDQNRGTAVGPRSDAPPPALPAPAIDAYVRRARLAKLAPLVDRAAAWLGRRRGEGSPTLSTLPATDHHGLHPVTRKVLAFDTGARNPAWGALFVLVYAGGNVLIGLGQLVSNPGIKSLLHVVVASLLTAGGLGGCLLAMAARVRKIDRLFATCVVVPGRIIAAEPRHDRSGYAKYLGATIESRDPGAAGRFLVVLNPQVFGLVGEAPVILFDPRNPQEVFIRDLYV